MASTEVDGRLRDDFSNLSFVNDPAVLGVWESVDFVREPADFTPGEKNFQGSIYLEKLVFKPEGKTTVSWFGWTKGIVMHLGGDHTASRYAIKEINGAQYMFFEWKSGGYIIRHKKPEYYVLKKK
jgi:bla regulator protein BlaR1